MIAIIPILPAVYSLVTLLGWGLVSLGALFGLTRNPQRRAMMLRFLWKQRFSLFMLAGGCWAIWQAGSYGLHWLRRDPISPRPAETGIDWPMFRGNLQRTGVCDSTTSISLDSKLWSGGWNDEFFSSPTIVGNRVYCVSGRDGTVYCWDLETGSLQWVTRPADWRSTFSSPVIADGRMYFGEGLHHTRQSRVACLDLRTSGRPRVLWTFVTSGHVECTPFVTRDAVYVAAGDDGLYKLALGTQALKTPEVLWHVPGDLLPDIETALVANDEHVYVGTGQAPYAVVELNPVDGQERRRLNFDFPVHAPPALADQRLYVGMGHGDYVHVDATGGGQVVCIDTLTGNVQWTFPTQGTILGAIVCSRGQIICGAADGKVRSIDLAGRLIHEWDSGAPVLASLAVTPEAICGVNSSGRLFVLNWETFQLTSEAQLGSQGHFVSSPAVARGRVIVGSQSHGVSCFGPQQDGGN